MGQQPPGTLSSWGHPQGHRSQQRSRQLGCLARPAHRWRTAAALARL